MSNLKGNFPAMGDFHVKTVKSIITIVFLIALIIISGCNSTILKATEGENVQLDFPYPCNSTEVTLRHGHGRPFYRSANPQETSLSPNQDITKDIDLESNQCFLNFTINPVSRNDESTFILMAYKDGVMLPDYPRIGLRVKYPPGMASCEIGDEYEGWVSLRCTAPQGTLGGKIVSYRNDLKLPTLHGPTERDRTLIQIILAHLTHLVNCCSLALSQSTERCECKDWGWDPIQNISTTRDPCPAVKSTKGPTSPHVVKLETTNSSLPLNIPTKYKKNNYYKLLIVIIVKSLVIFVFAIITMSAGYICCKKPPRRQSQQLCVAYKVLQNTSEY